MRPILSSHIEKMQLIRPVPVQIEDQLEYSFQNHRYRFPNNLDVSQRYKSFKTVIECRNFELHDSNTKKLRNVNKCQHIIQLKQIKQQEAEEDDQELPLNRYLLYYQAIPFNITYVKNSAPDFPLPGRIDRLLREVLSDLIDFNIYFQLDVQYVGFNEYGELKVYVPPLSVLDERKLTQTDKIKMANSVALIVKFWQYNSLEHSVSSQMRRSNKMLAEPRREDPSKTGQVNRREDAQRREQLARKEEALRREREERERRQREESGRREREEGGRREFGRREEVRRQQPTLREDTPIQAQPSNNQEAIDVKKTIKISKAYLKELYEKVQEQKNQKSKFELKKHKSLGQIIKLDNPGPKHNTFLSKIEQLNKKLSHIRQAIIIKKQKEPLGVYQQYKNLGGCSPKPQDNLLQCGAYEEQVIYEKIQEKIPRENKNLLQKQQQIQFNPHSQEDFDDQEQIDTYYQQIGQEYSVPKFIPSHELRKANLPTQIKSLKKNFQGKQEKQADKNSNWHHQSAGNVMFKRFILRNKEMCPQIGESKGVTQSKIFQNQAEKTHQSKISVHDKQSMRQSTGSREREMSAIRVKKILSLDNFQNRLETKSINLSQFSSELSTMKRRHERQEKNKQIKEKVQDILEKSKKAIQLLRNPVLKIKK